MIEITPELIKESARASNFMQEMKVLLWDAAKAEMPAHQAMSRYALPSERILDEIALELWKYAKESL